MALFSFLVFVTFYLSILFMQRKAEEAYSLTSTLTAAFIPAATTMGGKNEVLNWIDSVVSTSWVEPQCGDGRCEAPFEFPEYGRFGCKADCNIISANMNITKIQIDLYYNFSHPKGSISPIDLMNDAKWNLCPMEQDENVGPKKIFHGTDCYYEEDQGFEDQVGHIIRKIDDVPDGDWTIVVKKDIFLKVAGAVRPRVNVTKEATHKRLLLAAHYAQTRRKIELDMYDKILADLAQTNFTTGQIQVNDSYIFDSYTKNNTWLSGRLALNATKNEELAKEEETAGTGNQTLINEITASLAASENAAEEQEVYTLAFWENNRTMVEWATRTNGYCQNNFEEYSNFTRYKSGYNASGYAWRDDAHYATIGDDNGNTYPEDNLFGVSMMTNTTCRCVDVGGLDECFCYEAGLTAVQTADGTCDKCDKAKELADRIGDRQGADVALALCREVQQTIRPDLRLLVMSATLGEVGTRVAALLRDEDGPEVPALVSEGKSYPVETVYLGAPGVGWGELERATVRAVKDAVRASPDGDVLCFLPGAAEIKRVVRDLRKELPSDVSALPLYGALSREEQAAALAPSRPGTRRVVVSTPIAESSLTISGVKVVVDSGLCKTPKFDSRKGMTRLETTRVSKASADQRRGRAGRIAPGTCYRLWSESEQFGLAEFMPPEIQVADLAPLVLELAQWGARQPDQVAWVDAPPLAHWQQAVALLQWLDLLDGDGAITDHGKAARQLGTHPRLAHMVLRGRALGLAGPAAELAARDKAHEEALETMRAEMAEQAGEKSKGAAKIQVRVQDDNGR